MSKELPSLVKLITLWLLVLTLVFLGVKAWEHQSRQARVTLQGGQVILKKSPDGHFHWPGSIQGQSVDFLVDTGATRSALPAPLARALNLQAEQAVQSATAGGVVQGYHARADVQLQGGVDIRQLRVVVLPALATPLLGMDVLGKLRLEQADGELRITLSP